MNRLHENRGPAVVLLLAILAIAMWASGCVGSASATSGTSSNPGSTNPTSTSVTVSPSSASLGASGVLHFTAAVQGTGTDTSVTWTALLGSITPAGVYTAPSTPGTDTVTATSDANPSMSSSATVSVSTVSAAHTGARPAFPGAEGGGAGSTGGRGGAVVEVTNLNDSGTGSLRACVEGSGPRTCIFRVAGVIHPKGRIQARNPFLTIAGQSAPGGGITLAGDQMGGDANTILFVSTHDVVVRYLTCRIGLGAGHTSGPSTGASCWELASGNVYNVIFDHNTASWWDNKGWVSYTNTSSPIANSTVQWHLEYEPNAAHPVGPMTDANQQASESVNQDFHHNLYANIGHRLPLHNVGSMRWVNNIVYNYNYYALLTQAGSIDIIGNKYVAGNLNSGNSNHEFQFNRSQSSDSCPPNCDLPGPSAHLQNNLGPHNSTVSSGVNDSHQLAMTAEGSEHGDAGVTPVPDSVLRNTPLDTEAFPIAPDAVGNLDGIITPTVGNSQRVDCDGNFVNKRDSVDTRIINQYVNRSSGNFFTVVDSAHTIPNLDPGAACVESQHDGIPDEWKVAKGLSTTDPDVHKTVAPNGYTWLENYLNGPDGTTN